MAIPRIYWPNALLPGESLSVPIEITHHLLHVLRLEDNEPVLLFNGDREYKATLSITGRRSAKFLVHECTNKDCESPLNLELAVSLYRGKQFDTAIQKAVELGVKAITPVVTHKSDVPQSRSMEEKRQIHLEKILIAASEQSGRIKPPSLNPEINFSDWTDQSTRQYAIACDFGETTLQWSHKPEKEERISILIGPAGGFTQEESVILKKRSIHNLALGPRILRSDTAVTVALGLLQQHWGDLAG
jgi:16S rRNA (uracil1498-N3)-methyltransferase